MIEKYVVTQEFMNELEESVAQGGFVSVGMLGDLPNIINNWRIRRENNDANNRLIAIIRWVNGEDVFEVEKPKKWVIRSTGLTNDNEHYYVSIGEFLGLKRVINTFDLENATKFDTKEEAESWVNAHQEVIEVEE